jgi:hypothetical protein
MLRISDSVEFVIGNADILSEMPNISALRLFNNNVTLFLNELSKRLFSLPMTNEFPDMLTLAFWCRNSNISAQAKNYSNETDRIGKGLLFHIAPSNVALSFAYALILGLLSGNANIIRLPSRRFEQADALCNILCSILDDECFTEIKKRICMIKYGHDKDITGALSLACNARLIWGGDNTISEIRKSPLSPRANEITFSNRFSICLIDADKYLSDFDKKKTAHGFFIDTYLTDQNACSSPRLLFWFGKKREEAKEIFWSSVYETLDKYELAQVQTMNKLTTFYRYAAQRDCNYSKVNDCRIIRVKIDTIDDILLDNFEGSGYFYEYDAEDLSDIIPACKLECQTLSYIGFSPEELCAFIIEKAPRGVDRIVSVGKAMDFGLIWDGIDIIRALSRKISME